MGYKKKEIKLAQHEGVFTDEKEVTVEVPPDTTAAIFWLKNRRPKQWRDKQETEITGNLRTTIDPSKLSTEALQELLNARKSSTDES